MCAIAGMIDLQPGETTIDTMLETMARRGPDDRGVYRKDGCTLLHTRLAIIDPENGHQPMIFSREDETFVLVYNGELYNTAELRQELSRLGHVFQGHSDTEVVLHSYVQWRERCVDRFNGIFAFGVWEEKAKRLFLARDRMGVKPLFYKLHDGGMIFASEIKTILAFPTVRAELTPEGVGEILLLGPGRTPGCGVFRDVFELEPGCCGYYDHGRFPWRRYWQLRDREHRESFEETVETVRYLVTDSIRRQMVSDVPIGTFLSGGLDSSLISAICAGELAGRGEMLDTYSVDYLHNDRYFTPGKFQPNSDGEYIQVMKEYLHTRHHQTVLTPEDLVNALVEATVARDLPGMADVDFSLLAFCRQIRKDVKVALSGECADEIFGGYPWYRDPEIRDLDGFPWAQNNRQRQAFLTEDTRSRLDPEEFVHQRYAATLADSDILSSASPQEKRMKEMVNLNMRWFMQTLLDRKDRMSMYSGLEVRVPFCDYRIAEYLYGVPWEMKDYQGHEKGLLRQAMTGVLPDQVLWRKKSPYPKTYDPQYFQLVSGMLNELLAQKDAPIFSIVRRSALEELSNAQFAWPWYGQLMKVPQTIAYMLQVNIWLINYKISVI